MAQIVALIMVAQGGAGLSTVKVGEFLSMGACRSAAEHAVPVAADPAIRVSFQCVPLSPVSDADNRR